MKFIQDLKPIRLYSKKRKIYIPFDPKNKRKGAAILLLTPSLDSSIKLMQLPYFHNPNYFTAYYADRNVSAYIDSGGIIDDSGDEETDIPGEEPVVTEAILYSDKMVKSTTNIVGDYAGSESFISQSRKEIDDRYKKYMMVSVKSADVIYHVFGNMTDLYDTANHDFGNALSRLPYKCLSYSIPGHIYVLNFRAWSKIINSLSINEYQMYLNTESLCMCIYIKNPYLDRNIAGAIATVLTGSYDHYKDKNVLDPEFEKKCKIIKDLIDAHHNDYKKYLFDLIRDEKYAKKYILQNSKNPMEKIAGLLYQESTLCVDGRTHIINESSEDIGDEKYKEVLKICKQLPPEEFNYISFNPVYKNSANVIHRHIEYVGDKPAGFLDVYQFNSHPHEVYITLAVSPYYRRQGVADRMVKKVLNSGIPSAFFFNTWTWCANKENIASQKTAEKNGFVRDADLDKLGRYQYRIYLNPKTKVPLPSGYVVIESTQDDEGYFINDNYATIQNESTSLISFFGNSNSTIFNEAEKKYDARLKRYLYKERIRANKQVLTTYAEVKSKVPFIKRTFLKIEKYNKYNIFYDLYYYNMLFLKNNILKRDKGIRMYLDFITRLISKSELSEIYKHQTILISVDPEDWGVPAGGDMTDFTLYINPISMIVRLLKRSPEDLKKVFGGKNIIFVGSEGYFFLDFNTFALKHLARFRKSLKKLSSGEVIVDGEDIEPDDEVDMDDNEDNSAAALTASVVDKIENNMGIELPDVSAAIKKKPTKSKKMDIENLRIRHIDLSIPNITKKTEYGAAVILMSPNSTASASISANSPINNASVIDTYLVNK